MKLSGHRLLFHLACSESKDMAFQKLFERIMKRHDKSFMPVKPTGAEGDWKCDGYSSESQTVYQCYSPLELRTGKTSQKIRSDFDGASKKWGDLMKRWVFVWNADALPPQVVSVLAELHTANQAKVVVEHWGVDRLWEDVVSRLAKDDLIALLGEFPTSDEELSSRLKLARTAFRTDDFRLVKALCQEILDDSENVPSLLKEHIEASHLWVNTALKDDDLKGARVQLDRTLKLMSDGVEPFEQAHSHRLDGLILLREKHDTEAKAAFVKGLAVVAPATADEKQQRLLKELQCAIRADLILHYARIDQAELANDYLEPAETFIRTCPTAQDGQLLPWVIEALISLASRSGELGLAKRSLAILEENLSSAEEALVGARLLQRLSGRATSVGAPEIALECAEVSTRLAHRSDSTEDFWAAQFNVAATYFHLGKIDEAQGRLATLWPLVDSDQMPSEMRAAVLSLAAEIAGRAGDSTQAVELQQRVLSLSASQPESYATSALRLGHKLKTVGRIDEACTAFESASQIGRESGAPGEFMFDVLAPWCESEMLRGQWEKATSLLTELEGLPRPDHFREDVIEGLQQQINGSREIRRRVEQIANMPHTDSASTLIEANAMAMKPLLDWWREYTTNASGKSEKDLGLSMLYDYWGSGGASEVLANLNHFAPNHFSPMIEVRSIADIRRAIRMVSLLSDTLVLLWKGPIQAEKVFSVFPFDNVKGGSGYMFALGTSFKTATSEPWYAAIGNGAYLPEEVCVFLSTEASTLISQGRLIVLPAPAVGCWQPHHGPHEKLFGETMGTTLLVNRTSQAIDFPVGIVPYFEDAPISAISDLLGENPDQTRRLRLALTKKHRELRSHGSPENASRELRDEITDAFAEWSDLHTRTASKYHWQKGQDQLAADRISFQNQWSPVFTLSRLGYRWSIGAVSSLQQSPTDFMVAKGTPFGNWLVPPYEGKLILALEDAKESDEQSDSK